MTPAELSAYIKSEALRLGFDVCGITKAEPIPEDIKNITDNWVTDGKHGSMSYLERNCEKRYNPQLLIPGCKSIICVALNYYTKTDEKILHLSHYAQGKDYHKVVKDKLYMLLNSIKSKANVNGRPFCDSAPVLERYWAVKAGLGWIGKNRQLIIPKKGSFFFLGELIIDTELEYDTPQSRNFCGKCDSCLRNCPTKALSINGFDARKCLSYLTIEHREELPENIGEKMGNCFYGCDRCQTACPHNKFATETSEKDFIPRTELKAMKSNDWHTLTKEKYDRLFAESAVERCGYEQLSRNIAAIKNSTINDNDI